MPRAVYIILIMMDHDVITKKYQNRADRLIQLILVKKRMILIVKTIGHRYLFEKEFN